MRSFIVLAVLLALGYGGVQVYSEYQRQQGAQAQLTAGLKRIAVTQTAALSFDEKLATLEKAADTAKRTGRATPVEVTFTEQELTSKLAEAGTIVGPIAATDTQIHLTGGNVVATSRVTVQGIDVNVAFVATPVVEAGQAKLVVKEIQTGGVPIPDALKKEIQTQLGQAIDPRALGLPFDISKVTIVDGKVVISGTARP